MAMMIAEAVEVDSKAALTAARHLLSCCEQSRLTESDRLRRLTEDRELRELLLGYIDRFVSLSLAAARSFGRLTHSSALGAAITCNIDRGALYAACHMAAEVGRKLYSEASVTPDEIARLQTALRGLLNVPASGGRGQLDE